MGAHGPPPVSSHAVLTKCLPARVPPLQAAADALGELEDYRDQLAAALQAGCRPVF